MASLPRRTVQYWHDRGVITPINDNPIVYDNDGLILVRILAALTNAHTRASDGKSDASVSIGMVKEFSRIVRLCMADDECLHESERRAFQSARQGKEAYFGISMSTVSDGNSEWPWTFGATNRHDAGNMALHFLNDRPELGMTLINLAYCYNTAISSGVLFFENDTTQ